VQDSGTPQQTKSQALTIRIAAPLVINTPAALPDAVVGVPYSATLQAGGGIAPILWSVIAGAPPAGLQFSSAGVLSGTPTAPVPSTSFTVQAQDSSSPVQATTQVVTVHVASPLSVATLAIPDARLGVAYQQALSFSGGTGTGTWSITAGALPSGLSLSSAGVITGIPTTVNTAGTTFTVTVVDSGVPPQTATRSLTLRVAAPLTITTTTLASPKYGYAYSQTLTAAGGIPPLIWSLAPGSGPLPGGLGLSATGVITGAPTAAGSFTFTVQVADAGAPQQVATRTFTLVVPPPFSVSFYVQPSNGYVNREIEPDVKVKVADASGKAVAGVKVTLSLIVNPGGATLLYPIAITGYDGIATFDVIVTKPGVGYRLQAATNLAGAGTAISNAFNVTK
jgi:Putative Ig domain